MKKVSSNKPKKKMNKVKFSLFCEIGTGILFVMIMTINILLSDIISNIGIASAVIITAAVAAINIIYIFHERNGWDETADEESEDQNDDPMPNEQDDDELEMQLICDIDMNVDIDARIYYDVTSNNKSFFAAHSFSMVQVIPKNGKLYVNIVSRIPRIKNSRIYKDFSSEEAVSGKNRHDFVIDFDDITKVTLIRRPYYASTNLKIYTHNKKKSFELLADMSNESFKVIFDGLNIEIDDKNEQTDNFSGKPQTGKILTAKMVLTVCTMLSTFALATGFFCFIDGMPPLLFIIVLLSQLVYVFTLALHSDYFTFSFFFIEPDIAIVIDTLLALFLPFLIQLGIIFGGGTLDVLRWIIISMLVFLVLGAALLKVMKKSTNGKILLVIFAILLLTNSLSFTNYLNMKLDNSTPHNEYGEIVDKYDDYDPEYPENESTYTFEIKMKNSGTLIIDVDKTTYAKHKIGNDYRIKISDGALGIEYVAE